MTAVVHTARAPASVAPAGVPVRFVRAAVRRRAEGGADGVRRHEDQHQ
ncbi:hypothetical protein [Streptomyces sp. TE5632]